MNDTGILAKQNSQSSSLTQAWIVTLAASLFFFYEFIQMNMFTAIKDGLMLDLHLDATHYGLLSSTYFWGDVIFLIPAGFILDRFSTKRILSMAILVSITSTVVFSHLTTFWPAAFCRVFAGVGNAFSLLACLRLASRWFPSRYMALVTGIVVTIAFIGGLFAQTPLTILVEHVGWRNGLLYVAGLGAFIYLIILMNVSDFPSDYHTRHGVSVTAHLPLKEIIRRTFTSSQNWMAGIYTCLLNLSVFILGSPWGAPFLVQTKQLSNVQAANITSMIFVGTILGSPFFGWLSDSMSLRKKPMIYAAIISIFNVLAIIYVPHLGFWGYLWLFLLLGFITSAQIISYPLVTESNPLVMTGSALSLTSVLIMSGGAIFQPLFGKILDWNHDATLINGVKVYSASAFHNALLILPIAFLVALIASCCVRETHCHHTEK